MEAQRGRILVVEDDPDVRTFLCDALHDQGYQVLAAANGAQALELLAAEPRRPDVILLDMRMPAMDGATFAEAYRRSPEPRAPIVVVTAWMRERNRAVDAGVEKVLIKPVDLDALFDEVERQVEKHRRQVHGQPFIGPTTQVASWLSWLPVVAGLLAVIPGLVALLYH